ITEEMMQELLKKQRNNPEEMTQEMLKNITNKPTKKPLNSERIEYL
ncbi:1167_t:CDS:1, partial [Dentiscutata heterogama]